MQRERRQYREEMVMREDDRVKSDCFFSSRSMVQGLLFLDIAVQPFFYFLAFLVSSPVLHTDHLLLEEELA